MAEFNKYPTADEIRAAVDSGTIVVENFLGAGSFGLVYRVLVNGVRMAAKVMMPIYDTLAEYNREINSDTNMPLWIQSYGRSTPTFLKLLASVNLVSNQSMDKFYRKTPDSERLKDRFINPPYVIKALFYNLAPGKTLFSVLKPYFGNFSETTERYPSFNPSSPPSGLKSSYDRNNAYRRWEIFDRLIISMLHAFTEMESNGLVHHDLKPENVMYSERDDIFTIIDMGFSCKMTYYNSESAFENDRYARPSSQFDCPPGGTLEYADPVTLRAWHANPGYYSSLSFFDSRFQDIWAVTIMLYEILVGRRLDLEYINGKAMVEVRGDKLAIAKIAEEFAKKLQRPESGIWVCGDGSRVPFFLITNVFSPIGAYAIADDRNKEMPISFSDILDAYLSVKTFKKIRDVEYFDLVTGAGRAFHSVGIRPDRLSTIPNEIIESIRVNLNSRGYCFSLAHMNEFRMPLIEKFSPETYQMACSAALASPQAASQACGQIGSAINTALETNKIDKATYDAMLTELNSFSYNCAAIPVSNFVGNSDEAAQKATQEFETRLQELQQRCDQHVEQVKNELQEQHTQNLEQTAAQARAEIEQNYARELEQLEQRLERENAENLERLRAQYAQSISQAQTQGLQQSAQTVEQTRIELAQQHARNIQRMRNELAEKHAQELSNLRNELEQQHGQNVDEYTAQHSKNLQYIKDQYDANLQNLRENYENRLRQIQQGPSPQETPSPVQIPSDIESRFEQLQNQIQELKRVVSRNAIRESPSSPIPMDVDL